MINFQVLLNKYKIKADANMILDMWNESHRHFHTLDHLNDIIEQISENYGNGKINEKQQEKLILTALFHDIVYEPAKSDNEERSAEFFMNVCEDKSNKDILEIRDAILDTKTHASQTPLAETFNKFDMNIIERDFNSLLKWEDGIRLEFEPVYGTEAYKIGRTQFLEKLLDKYPQNTENLLKLIDWVKLNY
jgi:predicted metal-dependent HD superfamily phosphohydrolase